MKIGIEHTTEKNPAKKEGPNSSMAQALWDLHYNKDISKYKLIFTEVIMNESVYTPITLTERQFNNLSNLIKIVQSNYEVSNIEVDEKK